MSTLEQHFAKFKKHIIGDTHKHVFNGVEKKLTYADWTASGRLYKPIEDFISNTLGPYVANTHTETTVTGTTMTKAYHEAQHIIKKHVNANEDDVIIMAGAGMTAVINKFQRILGLRTPEHLKQFDEKPREERPLVIVTHMEHYSNQTSWAECCVDVVILHREEHTGLPNLENLKRVLEFNKDRKTIIGSFSGCSNVTGIITPYYEMAELIHEYNGYCFVDFAASAPYVKIDMHPENPKQKLDAVFFSPHKFLGGPGSSGVMIFDKKLYNKSIPDNPGGGTILSMNTWGIHTFLDDIEVREDGGTPGFLQAIKTALAIKLKEEMGLENIAKREEELKELFLNELTKSNDIYILEPQQKKKLCIISFYSLEKHHNLIVKILNDRYGIQTRGGVSCAGTYGHILLKKGKAIELGCQANTDNITDNTGWVRTSLHPTMTDEEVIFIAKSIIEVIENYDAWKTDYEYDSTTGEFNKIDEVSEYISLNSFDAING